MTKVTVKTKDSRKEWDKLVREMKLANNSYADIGIIGNRKHSSIKGRGEGGSIDIVELGTIHEFGTGKIPSRPFMRQTFDKNIKELDRFKQTRINSIIKGKETAKIGLEKIGIWYQGKTQKIFKEGSFTPNSPATIARKKSDRPLIDTGRLRQSISYRVTIK